MLSQIHQSVEKGLFKSENESARVQSETDKRLYVLPLLVVKFCHAEDGKEREADEHRIQ